ncbi:hypothetical protein RY27_16590, partial [Litorilinea aerophila]
MNFASNDVIIIGGGPAGSTLGSYLSMSGIGIINFQRPHSPPPPPAPSLLPSTPPAFPHHGFQE